MVVQLLQYAAAAVAVLVAAAYFYFTRNFGYWRKKGVPELRPLPFVGDMKDVALGRKSIGLAVADIYARHKQLPFVGVYAFDQPLLQVHDLELIKLFLIKESRLFCDRSLTFNEKTDPLPAKGLFGLKGDRWRGARNAITPSFTAGKLKSMYELVVDCGKLLADTLTKDTGKEIPVYELAARFTTDCIATCAFGIQGNTLKNPDAEFRSRLREAFEFSPVQSIILATSFLAPKLAQLLGGKLFPARVDEFIRSVITEALVHRTQNSIKRGDFLDSLIELKQEGKIANEDEEPEADKKVKYSLDDEELVAHAGSFLMAGFETSANTISYALYELALNPRMQERLRAEIRGALGDAGAVTYDTLLGLKYLDMIMSETLRKYPPLPFLDRTSNGPFTIPGTAVTLDHGSRLLFPLRAIQMDPEYFPNPTKFDPERFTEENKRKIINYTYMPFGEGTRSCVGKRFALMQTKAAMVYILRDFSVEPASSTPKEVKFKAQTFLLQPEKNFSLVLRKL